MTQKYLNHSNCLLYFLIIPTMFGVSISCSLSVIFWVSLSNNFSQIILLVGTALLFELSKYFIIPTAIKVSNNLYQKLISLLIYLLLTIISIVGSIGGLQSSFNLHKLVSRKSSIEYQALSSMITSQQTTLDTMLKNAKSDITYGYRTRGQNILKNDIPKLTNKITNLVKKRDNLSLSNITPIDSIVYNIKQITSLSEKIISLCIFTFLAFLIDLVSSFFVYVLSNYYSNDLYTKHLCKKSKQEKIATVTHPNSNVGKSVSETEIISINQQVSNIQLNQTSTNKSIRKKRFPIKKYQEVKQNILDNVHKSSLRQIIRHGHVSYPTAILILDKLKSDGVC